jgi:hypothetical protein
MAKHNTALLLMMSSLHAAGHVESGTSPAWQIGMRTNKHRIEEAAEAVRDTASEIATKVVHAAQERAQKVIHGIEKLATKSKNRRDELRHRLPGTTHPPSTGKQEGVS